MSSALRSCWRFLTTSRRSRPWYVWGADMKILFMIDRRANRGSIQAVAGYVRAGDELGHSTALYGRPDPNYPGVRCSTDLGVFDYVVFICEFGLQWMSGLRMLR